MRLTNQAMAATEIGPRGSARRSWRLRIHLVGGQGPAARPRHEFVDIPIEIAVDRVRTPASMPQTIIQNTSTPHSVTWMPGTSRLASTIAGTVVTRRSSMMRGLVSAMSRRERCPIGFARPVPRSVRRRPDRLRSRPRRGPRSRR